jgi:cytochrome b pre-mRNA-processing protein 3
MALSRLFARKRTPPEVAALYAVLVAQSRLPVFYATLGVPDTPEGRFDMIALHGFLIMERLSQLDPALSQALFDHLFADLDANLREMGVGDLMVGRRVKKLAQAFYGRSAAYREGLATTEGEALVSALDRNLFAGVKASREQLEAMALYVRQEAKTLMSKGLAEIFSGGFAFGPPPQLSAVQQEVP